MVKIISRQDGRAAMRRVKVKKSSQDSDLIKREIRTLSIQIWEQLGPDAAAGLDPGPAG